MKYFTGIGSRSTPEPILALMLDIAIYFCGKGYTLRSGGASGADSAFEAGAGTNKEIYLPWRGFNKSKNQYVEIPDEAYRIAGEFHPAWDKLKNAVKKLHARNVMQILGRDLETPSKLVICWTKEGKMIGGTAQAIRIAKACEIPVFNLGINDVRKKLEEKIAT
jgi:hypothetical protein